jgi:hypothetical protein
MRDALPLTTVEKLNGTKLFCMHLKIRKCET